MRPNVENLQKSCPNVDPELVQAHVERLDQAYFETFAAGEIGRHLQAVARLGADNPLEVLADFGQGSQLTLTVVAFDYPSEFSLITGVLAAMGFSIDSGQVFTYKPATPSKASPTSARCSS